MSQPLRSIPAVGKVLDALGECSLPRPVVTRIVRRELDALRREAEVPEFEQIAARVRAAVDVLARARIQPVINGTGVLVHTNLGRAPLGKEAIKTMNAVASGYCNLEYDLTGGERGGRAAYLEHALALLCGAEAAMIVNNCAAALVLVVRRLTQSRSDVIISRGELTQIGGGFRIPDILQASGARLREVGTTNKTSLEDYEKAIDTNTGFILKVHRSNFFMGGFVSSPTTEEIAELAKRRRLPFVEDLGSGAVIDTAQFEFLEHEATPAEVLKRGADLVTFSGDKLLGGPQAGIIAGKSKWITALKREPFYRAMRCDKLILSALQATVDVYLTENAERDIPVLSMLRVSDVDLRTRAAAIAAALDGPKLSATVGGGVAQMGGGTLPQSVIPSVTVDLLPAAMGLADFAARLRMGPLPVVGYVSGGVFKLDVRTILPAQDQDVVQAVRRILSTSSSSRREEAHSALGKGGAVPEK